MGCGCFFAKGSAESHSQARQAQRRRAGHLWRHTRLVPDGATLIRPTGSSHRLIPRRPGKRSAAGQDTSGAIPVLCRMALRLSGLRGPLTGSYLVGPASAAPPGRTPLAPYPSCAGWRLRLIRPTGASHRLIPRRPGKRSATGQDIRLDTRHVAGWRLAPYPAYVRTTCR
ncbi:Uncharacterised protein [Klebsiella quasipneumoniae]|nr:Uncharacterised protein [Klebsiella quasipneumoniae]